MEVLTIVLAFAVGAIRFGQALEPEMIHHPKRSEMWLTFISTMTVIFLVPILFVLFILIFKPIIPIICALIIMGCSPTANLSNALIERLGGSPVITKQIEFIASLFCIVTTPLLLELAELILGINLNLNMLLIIQQLILSQALPTLLGHTCRKWKINSAVISANIIKISSAILAISFVILIIQHLSSFAEISIRGYLAVILATISAFVLGVMVSGHNLKTRISVAIETSLRNPGLAYLIATENFHDRANVFIIPYTVTILLVIVFCIYVLKRKY